MPTDQGEEIPGRDESPPSGYVGLGSGIYVRIEPAIGGARMLHVRDRRQDLGSVIVDLGPSQFALYVCPDKPDKDRIGTDSPPSVAISRRTRYHPWT